MLRPPQTSLSLNPFEVREVLQGESAAEATMNYVSIPLKSGRCCKASRLNWQITGWVSIPLKSGRCCKFEYDAYGLGKSSQSLWSQGGAASKNNFVIDMSNWSQSLWSQGGAARVLYKTISLKSKCYLLICVKIFLTKVTFLSFVKSGVLFRYGLKQASILPQTMAIVTVAVCHFFWFCVWSFPSVLVRGLPSRL